MQIKAWNSVASKVNFNLEINTSEFKRIVPRDTIILDYGCGYGRTCETLNSMGYSNIVGVDSSPEMIKRGNLEYPHLSLSQSSEVEIKYPDGHFGAIVLCALLTCCPDHQAKINILAEIYRLLKHGGILHMVEFCSEEEKTFKSDFGVSMNHQPPNELRALVNKFTELKFEIVQTQTMTGKSATAVSYFGQKTT
jgi:ubiquinone/menaquinone biosynthesis C-methylase UbiE